MSARFAMLLAAPFIAAAFALRLGTTLWILPLTFRNQSGPGGLLVYLSLLAVSAGIPLGTYVLLTRSVRRRPATWRLDPDGRRFVAPASSYRRGPWMIVLGWWAGAVVLTERVPDQPAMRIAHLGASTTISIIVAATLLLAAVLLLVPNRPVLVLDSDGITLQQLTKRIRIRWDELTPGAPSKPGKRNPMVITLTRPGSKNYELPARDLHIDSAFLAGTIRRYTENAGHRDDIGTADELWALRRCRYS